MPQQWMMYPVFTMVILTLTISLRLITQRYRAVREGHLKVSYFKLNRGAEQPAYLEQTSQHYTNLFEVPVLFYAVTLFIIALHQGDALYLTMAWIYVALRLAHAAIHVTHNNLGQRRNVFIASVAVLNVIWIRLFIETLFGGQ